MQVIHGDINNRDVALTGFGRSSVGRSGFSGMIGSRLWSDSDMADQWRGSMRIGRVERMSQWTGR
jgi:hypothetical protein